MTVSSDNYEPQIYTGNGVTTAFSTVWAFDTSADIVVTERTITTGAETTKTLTTDYTVTGGSGAVGSVVAVTPPSSSVQWVLSRATTKTQGTDYTDNDPFPAETHEDALDKAMRIAQETSYNALRALRFPTTDSTSLDATLPSSVDRASNYLAFDSSGNPVAASAPTDTSVTTAFSETLLDDTNAATARATLGLVIGTDVLAPTGDGSSLTGIESLPNLLLNGDFRVAQRGTSFTSATTPANSDDTYLLDQWLLLSDGNDVFDVSQETTTKPTGTYSAIALDVETANKRGGVCQFLEARDAAAIIGGTASLSFQARAGGSNSTVDTVRAIIATWSSTADSITSDIVSAWGSEGANPTLATNWTIEGSDTFTLTTSFQTFELENVSIDTASGANVAVFIMIENDDGTVGDLVYISAVSLVPGALARTFRPRSYAEELALCERYLQVTGGETTAQQMGIGNAADTNDLRVPYFFRRPMRTAPTMSVSAASHLSVVVGATVTACTGATFASTTSVGTQISLSTGSTPFTQGHSALSQGNTTSLRVVADARL